QPGQVGGDGGLPNPALEVHHGDDRRLSEGQGLERGRRDRVLPDPFVLLDDSLNLPVQMLDLRGRQTGVSFGLLGPVALAVPLVRQVANQFVARRDLPLVRFDLLMELVFQTPALLPRTAELLLERADLRECRSTFIFQALERSPEVSRMLLVCLNLLAALLNLLV